MPQFLDRLLGFGRALRRAGIDVHPGRMFDLVEALGHIDLTSRDDVYFACRALLVHAPEQIGAFDRVFDLYWRRVADRAPAPSPVKSRAAAAAASAGVDRAAAHGESGDDANPVDVAVRTWSDSGGVAGKDFAQCAPAELAALEAAIARLVWTPGRRRTRRWTAPRGPRVDLRRAVAASRRTGTEVIRLPRRGRKTVPRPLVVLCDVSGSMERYSRMLLLFAHALGRRHPRTEAFLFSTRLTRVTRQMRAGNADAALAAVSSAVPDWSGGTRIGAAVRDFHQRWARRVLRGGPVVMLISDGWDRGEPETLRREIARLQRSCHRLVWLNPLIGTLDYAPLTRGLVAALPFVDDFLPARTFNNLSDLAAHLNGLTGRPGARRD